MNLKYLCPHKKFNVTLSPKDWNESENNYFEIIVHVKNVSMINSTN